MPDGARATSVGMTNCRQQPGTATGVTLADSLPGGNAATPVHWVIYATTGDPASFSISGADGSQTLSLANHKEILGDPPSPWIVSVLVESGREVLDFFQKDGPGWQDRIVEALRQAAGIGGTAAAITVDKLNASNDE